MKNPTLIQKTFLTLLGMMLALVLLEAGLCLGGFVWTSIQQHRHRALISQRGTYRILCLGESTTAGQYPPFLEEVLNQRKTGIKFNVIDKGIISTNTDVIVAQLESNLDAYHPDMVITMMGISDDGAHTPYETTPNSKFINFLKSCRTYKLARLFWFRLIIKPQTLGGSRPFSQQVVKKDAVEYKRLVEQGNAYRGLRKFPEAEEAYGKAIEIDPKNDWAHVELGDNYGDQGKYPEAEESYQSAIALNPKNDRAYFELGDACEYQRKYFEAERAYKKAFDLNPQNERVCSKLGLFYQRQGKYSEAVRSFKEFIERNPRNEAAYEALGVFYEALGDSELAGESIKKAKELRLAHYGSNTAANYRELKTILDKRGIAYVCVQYPMRDVESLKRVFQGDRQGVTFVDNEQLFKEAVQKAGPQEYFKKMFGIDFNYCTEKGNRLLAENIASAILGEVAIK